MRITRWAKLVASYFSFLEEHGFARATQFDRSSFWGTSVVYASARHAIRVTHSVEFDRVEVELVRLPDGALPEPMIFYDDAAPFDETLLDNVVAARAPQQVAETQRTGLGKSELKAQLKLWALLLQEVAADFLTGSDAALEDAKKIVRARVEQDPQQITVWLPSDASDQQEADALRETRSTAPRNVEVIARRYRR